MSFTRSIGIVKWFHDKVKDADYGFIKHPVLEDHYFNAKSLRLGEEIAAYKPNTAVVFQSVRHASREDYFARDVCMLETENNLVFLFHELLGIIASSDQDDQIQDLARIVQRYIDKLISQEDNPEIKAALYQEYLYFLNSEQFFEINRNSSIVKKVVRIGCDYFPSKQKSIFELLAVKTHSEALHHLWLSGIYDIFQAEYVAGVLLSLETKMAETVINKCSEDNFTELVDLIISDQNRQTPAVCVANLIKIMDIVNLRLVIGDKDIAIKELRRKIDENISKIDDEEILHDLWVRSIYSIFQTNYVYTLVAKESVETLEPIKNNATQEDIDNLINKLIFEIKEDNLELNPSVFRLIINNLKYLTESQYNPLLQELILACPISIIATLWVDNFHKTLGFYLNDEAAKGVNALFQKILIEIREGSLELDGDFFKLILETFREVTEKDHQHRLEQLLLVCPVYIKLQLWLEGYHDVLLFNEYKDYIIALSAHDQQLFIKKVLRDIHTGKLAITVEELTEINVMDYETSKTILNQTDLHVDYSVSVLLNALKELGSGLYANNGPGVNRYNNRPAEKRLYDVILNQVKNPADILDIKGFFDKCEGRCEIRIEHKRDADGNIIKTNISKERDKNNKPRFRLLCDGKKYIDANGKPIKDNYGQEYWRCDGRNCYEPSRRLHGVDEWEQYTLLDFLEVLKLPYNSTDYEMYLGVVNKVDRFLERLKCRKCNYILKPVKTAHYAVDGVTEFTCRNESCSEKEQIVYLTHCLNGFCESIIDSRDCVRCRPDGYSQDSCGWLVCNHCFSCCTSKLLMTRKKIYEDRGMIYKCATQGHREQGVISCNKCGHAMLVEQIDVEKQREVMDWFIDNKDKSNLISNYDRIKLNWFTIKLDRSKWSEEEFTRKKNNLKELGFGLPHDPRYKTTQLVKMPTDNSITLGKLICSNASCQNEVVLNMLDQAKLKTIKKAHPSVFAEEG